MNFAVVAWIFTSKQYRDILLESWRYCQKYRGLQVDSWCIMSNHVHLVVAAKNSDTSEILRDCKKLMAKEIIRAIRENLAASRKEWMLDIFVRMGVSKSRNMQYQFGRQANQSKALLSQELTQQKHDYLHNNPVAARAW